MITHVVGLSLGASSSIDSGVAIRELASGKLTYLDKFYSMNDIALFFENYKSLKQSVICVSLAWDNTMLDKKWRVISKAYQFINNQEKFLNIDNWMQRFSTRGCDLFSELLKQDVDITRYEIYLARQKLHLYSNYKERSTADCKFLQSMLKTEYGFDELPTNMVPASQLEAIIGTIIAEEKIRNNTKIVFQYKNLDVINII